MITKFEQSYAIALVMDYSMLKVFLILHASLFNFLSFKLMMGQKGCSLLMLYGCGVHTYDKMCVLDG